LAKKPVLVVDKLDESAKAAFYAAVDKLYKTQQAAEEATAAYREANLAFSAAYATDIPEGTNTIELGFGKQLKIDVRINRAVDKTALAAMQEFIDSPEAPGDNTTELKSIAKELLKEVIIYKPDVSVSNFKNLDDNQRRLLGDIVVEKPGSIGYKFHTPKA
jgi:hypothetical protein